MFRHLGDKILSTTLSKHLAKIDVSDIGRRSFDIVGRLVSGIGEIIADFHALGNIPDFNDKLKILVKGWTR